MRIFAVFSKNTVELKRYGFIWQNAMLLNPSTLKWNYISSKNKIIQYINLFSEIKNKKYVLRSCVELWHNCPWCWWKKLFFLRKNVEESFARSNKKDQFHRYFETTNIDSPRIESRLFISSFLREKTFSYQIAEHRPSKLQKLNMYSYIFLPFLWITTFRQY